MKRIWICFLLVMAVMLASLAGCSSEETANASEDASVSASESAESAVEESSEDAPVVFEEPANILTISGPTGIGMAKMMEENDAQQTKGSYAFTVAASPNDVMAAIVSGKADIAACPINLASKIYAKTNGGVQVLAVNTLGVLYVVTNQKEIHSFKELDGLSIVTSGKGATPEYAMQYLCVAYGISVDLQFVDDFSTAATMVASGACDVALLAEPSVTAARMKNAKLNVALNLTEVWREAGKDGLIENVELAQGCVIVRTEYAQAHPEAVECFLSDYERSVAFAVEPANLEIAASLCEKYEIVPKAPVAKMAIPNCNLVCITGADMKTVIDQNLRVLFSFDPASVGGSMPADNFYYAS